MATNNSVTFNRLITDKAEGLMEDTRDFVAMRAFGVATVAKRMGEYPKFKIEDLYRNSLRKRAVGAQYAETATDIEMVSFVCADYGVEQILLKKLLVLEITKTMKKLFANMLLTLTTGLHILVLFLIQLVNNLSNLLMAQTMFQKLSEI